MIGRFLSAALLALILTAPAAAQGMPSDPIRGSTGRG